MTSLSVGIEADLEGAGLDTSVPSVAKSLDRMLEVQYELAEVLNILAENGHGVWIVGGWVRDALSGKDDSVADGKDVDLATTATPEEMQSLFPEGIEIGVDFGTFGIRLSRGSGAGMWESTTLRSDGSYSNHRHPEDVSWSTSLQQDLERRDFTVNAMAIDPARRVLYDPHGGREDIASGLIRAVGVSDQRITEDALRILRAYRFLSHAGPSATIDEELHQSIIKSRALLGQVSPERWWQELKRMFSGIGAIRSLQLMEMDGVLEVLVPNEIENRMDFSEKGFESAVHDLQPLARTQVVLSSILQGLSVEHMHDLLRHWMTPRRTRELAIQQFQWSRNIPVSSDTGQLRRFRYAVGEHLDVVLCLMSLHLSDDERGKIQVALSELTSLRTQSDPIIDGRRLMEITGWAKGPAIGALKRSLHRLQIERDLSAPAEILSLIDEVGDQDLRGPVWP